MKTAIKLGLGILAGAGGAVGISKTTWLHGPNGDARSESSWASASEVTPSTTNGGGTVVVQRNVWAPDRLGSVQISVIRPTATAPTDQWLIVATASDVQFDTNPVTGAAETVPSSGQSVFPYVGLALEQQVPVSTQKWLYLIRPRPGKTWFTVSVPDDIEVKSEPFVMPSHSYEKPK